MHGSSLVDRYAETSIHCSLVRSATAQGYAEAVNELFLRLTLLAKCREQKEQSSKMNGREAGKQETGA